MNPGISPPGGTDATARPGRWWQGAVLYQVYVRSWLDTDGDGYGDLRGITARLDHLRWLGVDGIWLSPTMPSPDQDWGYDVSDYLGVHPELGTLADLDELIAEAGRRDMKVLLDLVPNHTSSAHAWFADARSDRDSAHRDFYVWADAGPDGGPPSNWLDATGRSAWEWDPASGQYYLHNFLTSQPDLNWRQPAVHRAFAQIMEFWFRRGVAGFRIDVAHGLYKDAELRDDPPSESTGPLAGRWGLRQVYSANRPETHQVYREWRSAAERHDPPRLLLGETWTGDFGALASYYGDDDELQLAFNFPFVYAGFTAADLSSVVASTLASLPAGACPVWTASNHDVGRFATRWCGGDPRKIRLALLLLATLPGTAVLYYGDEIGMPDVDVPPGRRRDHMTAGLPARYARDRGRTPMQWDSSPGGGFSSAEPWLPAGDAAACNVADQRDDPGSVLRYCRDLIALRRAEIGGDLRYLRLPAPDGVWSYATGRLAVAANLTDAAIPAADLGRPTGLGGPGDFGAAPVLLSSLGADRGAAGSGQLAPWEAIVIRAGEEPAGR